MASGIPAAELALQRKLTESFIAADDRDVVLRREVRVSNGVGGTRVVVVPLPPQTMRVLPQADSVSTERVLADGRVVRPTWVLLGPHTADMEVGDTFDLDDSMVGEVVYVQEKKAYQVKGEVVSRGPN